MSERCDTDEQGFTVWQRLDACDRAILGLTAQVGKLQRQYDELLDRLMPKQPPVAEPVSFGSIDKLVAQVERMFDCRNGDHRAYHTAYDSVTGDPSYHGYTVLGLLAAGEAAPERLRQELYTVFLKLRQSSPSERPVLYWRHAAQERIQEEHAAGTDVHKIRARVAIVGANFSVVGPIVAEDGTRFHSLGKVS